ncbi:MAG: hypothetical protein FJX65_00120 [Alphaproteobacteria bacterium]|nr:hypothetical protein [Alphaproteobacteria bacterium]
MFKTSRTGRRLRILWIVLLTPPWLVGSLMIAGGLFEGDDTNVEMMIAGAILIGATLPWLAIRVGLPRLWRDMHHSPLTIGLAIPGVLFGSLFLFMGLLEEDEPVIVGIGLFLVAAPLGWCLFRAGQRWRRRQRMVHDLRTYAVGGPIVDTDPFAVIPFVVVGPRIYYPLNNVLLYQDIDQLVWAYGEQTIYWYQLAIWNRDAHAVILPIHVLDAPEALNRLRAVAPWIATGFSRTLVQTWNIDHAEFLALIEQHRTSGQPFAPTWAAGSDTVNVVPRSRQSSQIDFGSASRREQREIERVLTLWSSNQPRGVSLPGPQEQGASVERAG